MASNSPIWTGQEAWEAICVLKHMRTHMDPFEFHAWAKTTVPEIVASRRIHLSGGRIMIEVGLLALLLPMLAYSYGSLQVLAHWWITAPALAIWITLWICGSLKLNNAMLLKHLAKGLVFFFPCLAEG